MAVVPGSPVLACVELVDERVTWSYRTLSNSINAIHFHGVKLSDAVPVNCRTVPSEMVSDIDLQGIPRACPNPRAGIGLVENFAISVQEAISRQCHIGKLEVVSSGYTLRGNCRVLIVCMDSILFVALPEPTLSAGRCRAWLPSSHLGILAAEVLGPVRRMENGIVFAKVVFCHRSVQRLFGYKLVVP